MIQFGKFLPAIKADEVYMITVFIRKKYLSEEGRKVYSKWLDRRSNVLGRRIFVGSDELVDQVRQIPIPANMPQHMIAVYQGVHTLSTVSAYHSFMAEMEQQEERVMKHLMKGQAPDYSPFISMDDRLMDHIQKAKCYKKYIDIDMDVPDGSMLSEFIEEIRGPLNEHSIMHMVVNTRSGCHLLIDKEQYNTVKKQVGLYKIIVSQNERVTRRCGKGEVAFMESGFIPLPGTFQCGFPVTFEAFNL